MTNTTAAQWEPIHSAAGLIGYVAEVRPGDWHAETRNHGEVPGCHESLAAAVDALHAHLRGPTAGS